MDAILNVYKPKGISSFSCVSQIRRLTGATKAGHAGTLDPEAEGVLPVCLGKATRCTEFFLDQQKRYRAEILFGEATDSRDCWGQIVERGDAGRLTEDEVRRVLPSFLGKIQQIPPVYSAIKQDGVPLYKRARRGEEVTPQAREVTIYRLDLLSFWKDEGVPKASLDVTCSKGTYIRSLCHDIGIVLGCYACMSGLVRTEYGPFREEEALTPKQLQTRLQEEGQRRKSVFYPLDFLLGEMPYVELEPEEQQKYRDGKRVWLPLDRIVHWPPASEEERRVRLYWAGKLFAISHIRSEADGVLLVPWKFFGATEEA